MITRKIGQSGIDASAIALGAWAIGGWMWGSQDDAESIRSIRSAIDAGINFIDTAPIYGFGRSEEVVGKAIKGRRNEVVVATKCGLLWEDQEPRRGQYHFSCDELGITSPDASTYSVYRYLGPESVRVEVEASLRRLGIDTIDLYQTHWQEDTTPRSETMETLLRLKEEGKIRAIGVSNASVDRMREYSAAGLLDADQELYSMLDRGPDLEQLPYCRENGMAFLAYSPLANGLLTGKIGPDRVFEVGDLRTQRPRFSQQNRMRVQAFLDTITPIAEERKASLSQIVLAWTIAQPGVSHALVGIRTVDQARMNAMAGEIDLSPEELGAIDGALARHGGDIV